MKVQIVKSFVLLSLAVLAVFILLYLLKNPIDKNPPDSNQKSSFPETAEKVAFEKFKTEEEFKTYLENAQNQTVSSLNTGLMKATSIGTTDVANISAPMMANQAPTPERYSQTNVQVQGVDEPDIVKTDGKEIYYSSPQLFYKTENSNPETPILLNEGVNIKDSKMMIAPVPPRLYGGTLSLKAFPPASLKQDGKIDKTGNLLLNKDTLVVLGNNELTGYSVKNPSNPSKEWNVSLKDNVQIVSSRLFQNKVYFITKTYLNTNRPCLMESISISRGSASPQSYPIRCTDIYHPTVNFQADSVYTVVRLNSQDGNIEKVISFVGSPDSSTIYMSENSLYATYFYTGSYVTFFYDFISLNSDIMPESFVSRIKKLNSYDISDQAKISELTSILEKFNASLTDDDQMKFANNLQNRMTKYIKENQRDLGRTGIVKVNLDSLDITAHSSVPGRPLNQFSLDEYQGNLRVATTVGNNWFGFGMNNNSETANDVYVLDKNLKTIGSVTDLGLTERIYSARFIEDKAYIVTFRQTDPFYVIDLSNPSSPVKAGELKIPGFSSYLHPITKDLILGVGMENSKVKLSLFDVSDPKNPQEVDKYNLDEYWTEVSNNHHAFLMDTAHKIFFLPGGKGGYIFSYKNNKLDLVKTTAGMGVKRALYIDNYLYVLSDEKVTVIDENNWVEINSLLLNSQ